MLYRFPRVMREHGPKQAHRCVGSVWRNARGTYRSTQQGLSPCHPEQGWTELSVICSITAGTRRGRVLSRSRSHRGRCVDSKPESSKKGCCVLLLRKVSFSFGKAPDRETVSSCVTASRSAMGRGDLEPTVVGLRISTLRGTAPGRAAPPSSGLDPRKHNGQ